VNSTSSTCGSISTSTSRARAWPERRRWSCDRSRRAHDDRLDASELKVGAVTLAPGARSGGACARATTVRAWSCG
jgi:hypothetical protein